MVFFVVQPLSSRLSSSKDSNTIQCKNHAYGRKITYLFLAVTKSQKWPFIWILIFIDQVDLKLTSPCPFYHEIQINQKIWQKL